MKQPTPISAASGQESVWDYPRPPRLERTDRHIRVVMGGATVAETRSALRVLETSHPPVYYIPPGDARLDLLEPAGGASSCEWKGSARYWSVRVGDQTARNAAWSYAEPTAAFAAIRGYLAFYPGRVDACFVDGEPVIPQPGGFYGGWITADVAGPFKGGPGSAGW